MSMDGHAVSLTLRGDKAPVSIDLFRTSDQNVMGELVKLATERWKETRHNMKLEIRRAWRWSDIHSLVPRDGINQMSCSRAACQMYA